MSDIEKALVFIHEIDQFKNIERSIDITPNYRPETDAEHTWHVAMMVWVLAPYYEQPINLEVALRMTLIHDLPEIDTGDTLAFDYAARIGKAEREQTAMVRIMSLLPRSTAEDLHQTWLDYEKKASPEAKFVNGVEKLQPIIQNLISNGSTWQKHHITAEQLVENKMPHITHSPFLTALFDRLYQEALSRNLFYPSNE